MRRRIAVEVQGLLDGIGRQGHARGAADARPPPRRRWRTRARCRGRRAACRSAGASSAMRLALDASRMNFIQRSVRIEVLSTPSMPALPHIAAKASPRGLRLPSSSPNTMRMAGAGLADDAGLDDGGADIGDAAHHRLLAQEGRQPLGGIDAVLQGNDGGVRPDHRLDRFARALDVPQLDAEQHDIDRPDGARDRRLPGSARDACRRAGFRP